MQLVKTHKLQYDKTPDLTNISSQDSEDLAQAVVCKVNDGTKPSDGWMIKFEEEFRERFDIPALEHIPDCVKRVEASMKKYFDTVVQKTAGVPIENILCKFLLDRLEVFKTR